jgi:transaldolase
MSNTDTYLNWLVGNTKTKWWHDSAREAELDQALQHGATGVTTNPVLASVALKEDRKLFKSLDALLTRELPPEHKAEALMRLAVTNSTERLLPQYEASKGISGFVCAQVNPLHADDPVSMYAMAKRIHAWAPNIAVKLPATAAGLDVLENCVAEGITVAATVSFSVAQVIATAERHRAAINRAKGSTIEPGKCFSVIMIGRLDDYLREVAQNTHALASQADICQAGLAVTKRAYRIFKDRGYEAVLLVAAIRGSYHLTELAGAELLMSIHPNSQQPLLTQKLEHEERIDCPVPVDVVERLRSMPDFVRAYDPQGMSPNDFLTFGATQKTLNQFIESGWKLLENYR